MENATLAPRRSGAPKEELTTLVKDAIAEERQNLKREIKTDMQIMREDILTEAHTYTNIMTHDMRAKIDGQFDNMENQFKALMEFLSSASALTHHNARHCPHQNKATQTDKDYKLHNRCHLLNT